MRTWTQALTLTLLNDRNKGTLADLLGIEFIEIGSDFLVAKMPVDHRHHQPIGIMHGGASCILAETVGSNAANCMVDQATHYCVGLDINTNHLKPISQGYVTAVTRPYHIGKKTQVWSIEIENPHKKLVSISRLTIAVLSRSTELRLEG